MSGEVHYRNRPDTTKGSTSLAIVWLFTLAALAVLSVGLVVQSPWWMLSVPLAVVGAITAGMSRRFVPMVLCIAVVALLFVVLLIFAP